jgi:hypothetical protein
MVGCRQPLLPARGSGDDRCVPAPGSGHRYGVPRICDEAWSRRCALSAPGDRDIDVARRSRRSVKLQGHSANHNEAHLVGDQRPQERAVTLVDFAHVSFTCPPPG